MIDQINHIAQSWWVWMWPIFWQVGLLIVLIAGIDLVIRRWAWPQLRYALYLLILVKLVLPPSLSSPVSLTGHFSPLAKQALEQQAPTFVVAETEVERSLPAAGAITQVPESNLPIESLPAAAVDPVPMSEQPLPPPVSALSWRAYVMSVWLLGVGLLSCGLLLRLRRLRRQARRGSGGYSLPPWFWQQLTAAAEALRLRRLPAVVVSDSVASPAVFGLFRPVLLVPAANINQLSRKVTQHVLLHELAHIKRRDLLVHALNMILLIIYWPNPLLWLVRRRFQHRGG